MLNLIGSKIKNISFSDIFGSFIFFILLIPSLTKKLVMKRKKEELWLICERTTARDNGYTFYKYMKENHPEIKTAYAVDFSGIDYEKIKELGNGIKWGSIKHYFYYMTATWNITSHKEGNPNHMLFTILQRAFGFYDNVIFLQHGVLYQDFKMFYRKNCLFRIFICGAKGEYDFVNSRFGYDDEVKYTGLARFDNLHDTNPDRSTILFIPTWRRWLCNETDFKSSEYFSKIMSLLNSSELENLLCQYNMQLLFYPHAGTWSYSYLYCTASKHVRILDPKMTDIQELLKRGILLITDYSSIFTDFSYMEKPIVYYQYDQTEYLHRHYQYKRTDNQNNSYFDYGRDGFGPVVHSEKELLDEVERSILADFTVEEKYLQRIHNFFVLHDNKNCERIFQEIEKL